MIVPFGMKFCARDLDDVIKTYWQESTNSEDIEFVFDLSIMEWINLEEIAFLFSWIIHLKNKSKKIKVILPFHYNISYSDSITDATEKIRIRNFTQDDQDRIDRRKRLNLFLLSIWGMISKLGLKVLDFNNIIEGYNKKDEQLKKSLFSHRVIPFTVLDSNFKKGKKILVDREFEKVLEGKKSKNNSLVKDEHTELFKFKNEIITLLTHYSCFSPFESKIISHVITKELFMNSLEHSGVNESYFTISLSNKWDYPSGDKYLNHFTQEKDTDTLDFFKDKSILFSKLSKTLNLTKISIEKQPLIREANLKKYNDDFTNLSYLEFTYLDFGQGIFNTLKKEYYNNEEHIKSLLSNDYINQHEHTKILEYAFLLESSKNPYDREIEYSELIPRGLYFLIDMVRRFKGLLVARSGYGKVIFDFSDKIYLQKNDNKIFLKKEKIYQVKNAVRSINNEPPFFQGTMISIVLPERKIKHLKRSGVRIDNEALNKYIFNIDEDGYFPKKIFSPEFYEYVSLAFLYQQATDKLSIEELNDKNSVSNYIFQCIDKKLNVLKGKNCVLFIDFEFLSERENYLKIITWLTNSPKINEFTKIIIVNLTEDESSVIKEFKENFLKKDILTDTDFLYKPIPCIKISDPLNNEKISNNIDWVGVRDENDEALLTNLFFGFKYDYDLSLFKNKWVTEGNVIAKHQGKVYSIFSDYKELVKSYKESKQSFLSSWIIKNSVKDGENPKPGKSKHIFLTSRGSYQKKYVSLYETLHNKYIARLFAKFLLDTFIEKHIGKGIPKEKICFNKIIVVTISSQLIGVAIRDLIRDNSEYEFLRNPEKNKNCSAGFPNLIRLASYFSFDSEKPFEEIKQDDDVIIVNDVISTGSLINRLIQGIDDKNANVVSIFTIVDSRLTQNPTSIPNEMQSVNLGELEKEIISILSSNSNKKLRIEKLINKPEGNYEIKRINPILNTVVELSYEHSEKSRVLYNDFHEFISESFCKEDIFRIGHYKQNLTHNSYFTNMSLLFQSENGRLVLEKLKEKIEKNIYSLEVDKNETILTYLRNAQNNLNNINQNKLNNTPLIERINSIKHSIAELANGLNAEEDNIILETPNYCPDYIFHPVFSGIEEVSDKTFKDVFQTDIDNIIGLQRYDTRNGWRFPFPAKRYNKLTKGKHILIIDSGSLTGDSLIQLVDSISFLEVGRIDFLSVVGRIDDFQREFYSRLKSIKVKSLKQKNEQRRNYQTIVNLNLLFGVNLHIPPYSSSLACPFCQEAKLLESYLFKSDGKDLPEQALNYINHRLKNEIKYVENKSENFVPYYIPTDKETKSPDYKNIFLMRDRIGKVDSYRFYNEYFKFFDEIVTVLNDNIYVNKDNLKQFEIVLICLLHEPSLFGVFKDLLVNVYNVTSNILEDVIINNNADHNSLYFDWNKYSLIRLINTFWEDNKYSISNFEKLFEFCLDDSMSLNYLSFLLLEPFLQSNQNPNQQKVMQIVSDMSNNFDIKSEKRKSIIYSNKNIRRIIKDLILTFEPTSTEDANQAYFNLKLFFDVIHGSGHNRLLKENISFLNTIINNENENEFEEIKYRAESIIKLINKNLYDNLKAIKHSSLYRKNKWTCHEFLFGKSSVEHSIITLNNSFESLNRLEKTSPFSMKLEMIRNFQQILVQELQTKYLLTDTRFHSFCMKYYVNLKSDCIDKVMENDELKKEMGTRKNFAIDDFNFKELDVQGHEEYFYYAFLEIFRNAAKREENDDAKLTFNVVEKNSIIELTIHQNRKYIPSAKEASGGIEKIIKPVFETFCGVKNIDFVSDQKESYDIIIKFNKKELKAFKYGK